MWVNEYDCGRWPRGAGGEGESARMPREKKNQQKSTHLLPRSDFSYRSGTDSHLAQPTLGMTRQNPTKNRNELKVFKS